MDVEDYFRDGKVSVQKGTFAIMKSTRAYPGAFANIVDKNEITVIIEQSKYATSDAIQVESGWKILTFDMFLPLELVGFLAKVSQALAEEGVPIFTISAYSTDHVLVKEKDLAKAKRKIGSLGIAIVP
jgi:hypothetical protein